MSTRRLLAVVVLVPLLAALALWAFAWPAARTAPRDLPLGVAGPAAATAQVEKQLRQHEGAFEIHRYADERAARAAIEDRTVYGAVVVTAQGPELLTASAASPVVAQLLQQAVTRQAAAGGAEVRTVDVVPAPVSDPRGAALSSSVLPLALSGIIAGAVVTLLKLRGLRAVTALVLSAALVGVVAAALADSWLGVIAGNWWAEAGTLALATLAVSAAVAGLAALVGPAGIGVVAFLVMFLGNPFSGASSAPQLLPDPVGTVGQWLPPGASATLLRSVAFFDGAAATGPLLTLTWWAALGLGAVVLGNALPSRARGTTSPSDEPALAPVG
ncbi:VIT1/CCC1 family predicted Fe2+/Mn2+ transporter [Streptomyces sp. SAI-135]|uniref:ABC transporter permease n=1 Tax=unclassified Streptomyces TaxID=2593676 RepID=UPI0024751834|nr:MULTISPECIES: ABC transporter permease [unclassified Streptomyces]MDH6520676.1 VIT1/CCC1 family predicted Fe2+/Mn2+ transporter [Streptomyces sp. SAI-090]MDH6552894.1 VIT1/CCC1 family predicted Fe2+/Mn2+ transporter [Streptomyces sp. SAI-041]MDH6571980.1 VIT1/CCC1 family predicted Fe2+/Mn2+ transporter [Streptomyces sp. SAI-117]MDH6615232.1 VIT1/CCC1 family predicted Fe2+/Mn2+ transporter [Streptomyces sp. SAI-135]